MAKLQVLSGPLAGQSYELKVETTTVGRVEDNAFQIADPSVSSHHCEMLLRGGDVVIRDLNSTNGSFINGEKITEATLKPGQVLRLGQVDLRIDDGTPAPAPSAPAQPLAPAPANSAKPRQDQTMIVQRGVSLDQLTEPRTATFKAANTGFTKKTNKVNRWFLIGGIVVAIIIVVGLVIAFKAITSQ
jgi:predicted component of type VI protein secretion system